MEILHLFLWNSFRGLHNAIVAWSPKGSLIFTARCGWFFSALLRGKRYDHPRELLYYSSHGSSVKLRRAPRDKESERSEVRRGQNGINVFFKMLLFVNSWRDEKIATRDDLKKNTELLNILFDISNYVSTPYFYLVLCNPKLLIQGTSK